MSSNNFSEEVECNFKSLNLNYDSFECLYQYKTYSIVCTETLINVIPKSQISFERNKTSLPFDNNGSPGAGNVSSVSDCFAS